MKKVIIFFVFLATVTFSGEILTLDDAVKIALENNLKIQTARTKIEQAYYQKRIAGSYFFPRLSTSFNYTYLGDNQPISFGPFPPMTLTDDNLYTLKFTVSQPLFTGGKIIKGYEISEDTYQKAKIDYETEIENLILDVRKAYFNLLKAQKILDTGRNYKALIEKHLKDVKEMFEEGLATKLDILKTELALKEAETGIIQSENYVQIAKTGLNFLLNRPSDTDFEVEDINVPSDMETIKPYDWWRDEAMRKRPEIKSMEKVLSIYSKKTDLEKSNLFPQVYLFFNYQTEKGTEVARDDWKDSWNTGVMLSLDIWNWGETIDRIKKAKKEREEMESNFELLKRSIDVEVKNAYLNLLSAEKRVKQCKKQIEVAEENVRVAEMLYKEGMATTTDLLDATNSLTDARNTFYNAVYEWEVAYSELEKASGQWRK